MLISAPIYSTFVPNEFKQGLTTCIKTPVLLTRSPHDTLCHPSHNNYDSIEVNMMSIKFVAVYVGVRSSYQPAIYGRSTERAVHPVNNYSRLSLIRSPLGQCSLARIARWLYVIK